MGEVKARDIFRTNPPTFENKLLYCQFVNKYNCDCELAWGFQDGANACLNKHSRKELEALRDEYTGSDDYEKGFRAAINDFIKEMELPEEGK